MVNVSHGAHIQMRFTAVKFYLRHNETPFLY
jgi:hypothetical protein